MARSDLVQLEGVVKEVMVGGNFRVEVEGGHNVLAQLAGNMRRNRIRVVLGDQVTVAVSPYDPRAGSSSSEPSSLRFAGPSADRRARATTAEGRPRSSARR